MIDEQWLINFFGIDILCVMANAIFLRMFCKIDLVLELCGMLKKYWFIMAIKLVSQVSTYFISNDINLGRDFTFQFNWITDKGRSLLMLNSTDQLENQTADSRALHIYVHISYTISFIRTYRCGKYIVVRTGTMWSYHGFTVDW